MWWLGYGLDQVRVMDCHNAYGQGRVKIHNSAWGKTSPRLTRRKGKMPNIDSKFHGWTLLLCSSIYFDAQIRCEQSSDLEDTR